MVIQSSTGVRTKFTVRTEIEVQQEVIQPRLDEAKREEVARNNPRPSDALRSETRQRARVAEGTVAHKLQQKYEDEGAGKALNALPKTGTISGFAFRKAITDGTEDRDNQAAGAEFRDLTKFYTANKNRMAPEAIAAYDKYKEAVDASVKDGRTGIRTKNWNQMGTDMKMADVAATVQTHADVQMDKHGTEGKVSWNKKNGRFEVSQEAMQHAAKELLKGNRKPMNDLYYTLAGLSSSLQTEGGRSLFGAATMATDPKRAQEAAWLAERSTYLGYGAAVAEQSNARYAMQLQAFFAQLQAKAQR